MGQYLIKRFFLGVLTLWVLTMISWVIIELPPGDFVDLYVEELIGDMAGGELAEFIEAGLRKHYGLDKPSVYRYGKWMWHMLQGDLGMSLEFGLPVTRVVSERLLLTIILAVTTAIFAWGLAIPIGIYSAVRQHSPEDYVFTFVGFLGLAVPDFLLALWLLWVSFAYIGQSVGGLFSPEYMVAPWSFARVWDLSLIHI